MSTEKAAIILSLSKTDNAVYKSKRNQRAYWQRLTHDEWVEFCETMAAWFANGAADEWDNYVIANNARKEESDAAALVNKNATQGAKK